MCHHGIVRELTFIPVPHANQTNGWPAAACCYSSVSEWVCVIRKDRRLIVVLCLTLINTEVFSSAYRLEPDYYYYYYLNHQFNAYISLFLEKKIKCFARGPV